MKEILVNYRKMGFSLHQLLVIGFAYNLGVDVELIANKEWTPKEMSSRLDEIVKERGDKK